MGFFAVAFGISCLAAGAIIVALARRRADTVKSAEFDRNFYIGQLKEIDQDLDRGALDVEQAEAAKIEVSRRILAADKAVSQEPERVNAPRWAGWTAYVAITLVVVFGSLLIYSEIGSPKLPDMPLQARLASAESNLANRLSQQEFAAGLPGKGLRSDDADATGPSLVKELREAVAQPSASLITVELLALNELHLGNLERAWNARLHALKMLGTNATADEYVETAEIMIASVAGYVSPESTDLLQIALELDVDHPTALYYVGFTFAQTGRPDIALFIWDLLLQDDRLENRIIEAILKRLPEVSFLAGVEYTVPDFELTEIQSEHTEDPLELPFNRRRMIGVMVERLKTRFENGDTTSVDWARWIRSLSALGFQSHAVQAWTSASKKFSEQQDALAEVTTAARMAGVLGE